MRSSPRTTWARFIRFEGDDGKVYCGEPVDSEIDVGLALYNNLEVFAEILNTSTALDQDVAFTGVTMKVKRVLSPLTKEEVGTIRCIGVNYHDHGEELNFEVPPVPIVFLKPDTALNDPSTPIILPRSAVLEGDFEVELVVVLSKECRDVSASEALNYVLGYMTGNDVAARVAQFNTSQFCFGKGFDGFAPMGPVLVSAKEIPDPSVLVLKSTLNGKVMQDSKVSNMIFPVPRIIEHLSTGTTLKAGTVIMTGTPGGIGHSRTPPVYLAEGDELRICISHGLGTLTNPITVQKSK